MRPPGQARGRAYAAPAYIGQDTFKVTINANGELVVLREETPDGEDMHCVGPTR